MKFSDFYPYLIWSVPVVVGLAVIEALVLIFVVKRQYDWRASLASLADMLMREFGIRFLVGFSIVSPLIALAWANRVTTMPLDTVPAIAILFLGQEFCYYWFHRASHRVRWFWATHAVHHSPNELNLSASYRFGLTGRLTGTSVFYVPLIWLGFPPAAVFATLAINLLYQFILHTTWIPKLGWYEYVFNTPSHHRVHHASNAEYLDANYGGVLIVFDRLFGTFVEERADLPCVYGLTKPVNSYNPIYIALHEWIAMGRDVWQARSWRERVLRVVGPPGWTPGRQTRAALAQTNATANVTAALDSAAVAMERT
jgi:sterol desaturase/sphingolipid hydroxylase (fatty acid hydroxylase superfamily)